MIDLLDLFIKNGQIPDFEKNSLRKANLGVEKGKIVYIGEKEFPAAQIIDADGKVVSPGFIDIHMHEENFAAEGKKYVIAEMMLKQGVTTCVGGNCGIHNQNIKDFKAVIEELGGSPVNYIMLSGYNTYRVNLGLGHFDEISEEQQNTIKEKIREDLAEGAWGISFGIEYDPGITSDDIIDACSVSDDENLLVAAHYRADCIGNIDSVKEMVDIQNNICQKFQISHLSSCSAIGQMEPSLECINKAMEKDPRLNYDTYPYNAFSTHIASTVFDDGCLEAWGKEYSDLLLTDNPYKNVRCTEEIFRECREKYPEMLVVAFVMNEDEIGRAIANPNGMVASDGIINNGNGHPRAAGTFPRVLGKYVREDKLLSLTDALRKTTLEPAKRLGVEDRKGIIAVGADADLTIFDPETIIDGATFGDLNISVKGIDYVIVGGEIALQDNEIINGRKGRFIPYKKA